ncbi:hypothetical protein AAE478_005614 [Parahypoxylon ruwenzoriense]
MPLHFYHGPDYNGRSGRPMTEQRCTSYLKRVKTFNKKIPAELALEEIVRNKTRAPCSLGDFIDYLVYMERNAENLQFFLWYCDYIDRWSQLPESQKESSPTWNASKSVETSLGERINKLNRILMILRRENVAERGQPTSNKEPELKTCQVGTNFSRPRTLVPDSGIKENVHKDWKWQPFSVQPFRDEVTQIARHYIYATGPRSLNLSHQDRTACVHALQHTTHPSAFLPVFIATEAVLRGQSHPNFIQWSICNSNHPRVLFARTIGAVLAILAFVLEVVLILSNLSRFARLSAVPIWYIGLYMILIGGRGISIGLYINRRRHLRPWERASKTDLECTEPEARIGRDKAHEPKGLPDHDGQGQNASICREDLLRKERLEALGPANNFEGEPWVASYRRKPIWQRVFDVSIASRNKHLIALQDRAVFTALLWASFLVVLTVSSVLIPPGNLF